MRRGDADEMGEKMGQMKQKTGASHSSLMVGMGLQIQSQAGVSTYYHKLTPKAPPSKTTHIRQRYADLFPVAITNVQGDKLIKSTGFLACGFGSVMVCH